MFITSIEALKHSMIDEKSETYLHSIYVLILYIILQYRFIPLFIPFYFPIVVSATFLHSILV